MFAQVTASPNSTHLCTRHSAGIDKTTDHKRAYNQEVAKATKPSPIVHQPVSQLEAALTKLAKTGDAQAVSDLVALRNQLKQEEQALQAPAAQEGYNESVRFCHLSSFYEIMHKLMLFVFVQDFNNVLVVPPPKLPVKKERSSPPKRFPGTHNKAHLFFLY